MHDICGWWSSSASWSSGVQTRPSQHHNQLGKPEQSPGVGEPGGCRSGGREHKQGRRLLCDKAMTTTLWCRLQYHSARQCLRKEFAKHLRHTTILCMQSQLWNMGEQNLIQSSVISAKLNGKINHIKSLTYELEMFIIQTRQAKGRRVDELTRKTNTW